MAEKGWKCFVVETGTWFCLKTKRSAGQSGWISARLSWKTGGMMNADLDEPVYLEDREVLGQTEDELLARATKEVERVCGASAPWVPKPG